MRKLDEGKVRWVIGEKAQGRLSTGEIAMVQRVSHRWVERLWQRYRSTGLLPFPKPSGRPGKPITGDEVAAVLNAYDRYRVNALLLERVLLQRYGVRVSHNRAHRILRMHGRARVQPAKGRRRRWVRYERSHSLDLWHMDWFQMADERWLLAVEDDASRLVMSYGLFEEATSNHAIAVLEEAMARYGAPLEVLTDQGTQFYAAGGEGKVKGVSSFEESLAERGIRHVVARVNHPQTNGKIERFYQTVGEKLPQFKDLDELVEWHNTVRPHMSLNLEALETPIQAFERKLPHDLRNTTTLAQGVN